MTLDNNNQSNDIENSPQGLKQCMVVRTDLGMSCGKKCAQVAHASLGSYLRAAPIVRLRWKLQGYKKIVLKAPDLTTLLFINNMAELSGLPHVLVIDQGLTQIEPHTTTVLGIGPAKSEDIDKITKDLKLL